MKFDDIFEEPCALPVQPCDEKPCPPSSDDRCADPAFADANPDICCGYPRLILKPGILCLSLFNALQLEVFLYANGVTVELTNGLTFISSDQTIAVVGAVGGKVTAMGVGICWISVQWQNLKAFCEVSVSSTAVVVGNMLCIDRSIGMRTAFDVNYPTRLDAAEIIARSAAEDCALVKDFMGLITFDDAGLLVQALTQDGPGLRSKISSTVTTDDDPGLADAIKLGIDVLVSSGVDRRVLIIIAADEEDVGPDAVPWARQFKESGGVIMVVAVGASDLGFDKLAKVATPGYFLEALPGSVADTISNLRTLMTYVCGGCCDPTGGNVTIPEPKLDYTGFINWTVASGHVDLIGTHLMDLIPGNGLYVDLAGSSAPWLGELVSKTYFNMVAGHSYRLTVKLAGNQRVNKTGFTVSVRLGSLVNATLVLDDWKQGFTDYVWNFTPGGPASAPLIIQQLTSGAEDDGVGNLLAEVILQDITANETLLDDDFDLENPTYIPPKCVPLPPGYSYPVPVIMSYSCCPLVGSGSPEGVETGLVKDQIYNDSSNGDRYYFNGTIGQNTGWVLIPMILSAGEAHIGKVGGETVIVNASMTRPADTTAYASGDVINTGAVTTVPLTFSNVARIAAGTGTVLHAWLLDAANQASLLTSPELWLFDSSFTANNDNAPWAPLIGDLWKLVAVIPFPDNYVANPAAGAAGSVVFDSSEINRPFKCPSGQDLYGVIVVRNSYTPVSAEGFTVRLEVLQD